MNGKFAKIALITIAILEALLVNIYPSGPAHAAAMRVILFFLAMLPVLGVGCLLKYLCCCKQK